MLGCLIRVMLYSALLLCMLVGLGLVALVAWGYW